MNRRVVLMGVVCTGIVLGATAHGADYTNPNGTTVVCLHDSSQTYELYIPPEVVGQPRARILYVFDPGGDGSGLLRFVQPAAREMGWIVAASNNSRNGPYSDIYAAQDALIRDTEARLSLHPHLRYAAGFSGGARAALALAFRYPQRVAGVLAIGAGYPWDTGLEPGNDRLVVEMQIGEQDSNIENDVPTTAAWLTFYGLQNWIITYDAGHVWPPQPMILEGFQRIDSVSAQDADNDGWLDWEETEADADADGLPNWLDPDSDNDGALDYLDPRPYDTGNPDRVPVAGWGVAPALGLAGCWALRRRMRR
jgi:pimeloyl-ACP methyl ester carboxylesterase